MWVKNGRSSPVSCLKQCRVWCLRRSPAVNKSQNDNFNIKLYDCQVSPAKWNEHTYRKTSRVKVSLLTLLSFCSFSPLLQNDINPGRLLMKPNNEKKKRIISQISLKWPWLCTSRFIAQKRGGVCRHVCVWKCQNEEEERESVYFRMCVCV